MAYVPNSGSVVAFQSDPSQLQASVTGTVSIRNIPSIYGNISGSVAAFLNSTNASVITVSSPVANQSVSGTVGASIIGLPPFVLGGSTNASVITVGTPVANQSVSGTVGASIIGLPPFVLGGSTNASVITVGSPVANQSVSGTVGASLVGVIQYADNADAVSSTAAIDKIGVVARNTIFVNSTGNWERHRRAEHGFNNSGGGVAAAGIIAEFDDTTPSGVSENQFAPVRMSSVRSLYVTIRDAAGNERGVNVDAGNNLGVTASGSVVSFQGGAWSTSVMTNVITSIATAGQVMGSIAALQATNPWNIAGSVATFQAGTIITSVAGTVVIGSIVGTYSEDVPSTAADKGLFTLGIRNDTVASLVGTDLDYTGWSTDSAGRHLVKPFAAEESRVEGYNSVVSASVTTLVGSAGAGLKNYITDIWVANTGGTTTLVTFKDGLGSILGYTIAPAGGGSNLPGLQMPIRTGAATTFDFQAATSTSVLYVTVKGYKAP